MVVRGLKLGGVQGIGGGAGIGVAIKRQFEGLFSRQCSLF